jgi:Fe-S-cluster-containing dehydrogenase component
MEPLIVFDAKKCICCHSCEVACQLENDAPPGLQLRRVTSHVSGKFPECATLSISTACFHCNDPSCVSACPAGALQRRTNGVVEHVRSKCIGCGYCIQTCPFHVPQFSPAHHTMRKCSFCLQRIDYGMPPACVAKCATGALTFFPDEQRAGDIPGYGKNERLHMVYEIEGKAKDYSLPDPVPLNTVTSYQLWKWLIGLIPGAAILGWLWKSADDQETGHE